MLYGNLFQQRKIQRDIYQATIRQKQIGKPTRFDGDVLDEELSCVRKTLFDYVGLHDDATKEVGYAHTERGDSKTGHVLVATQGDGQKAVQQSAQARKQQRKEDGDQNSDKAVHRGIIAQAFDIDGFAEDAAQSAQAHNAGDTQIEVAALFGDGFASSAEKEYRTKAYRIV